MPLQSVKEIAKKFNLSERRIQKLCEEGRIKGAKMIKNVWMIPENAEKPIDKRFLLEQENMVPLSTLCETLSISIATGRNWLKLGKLTPSLEIENTPYFTHDDVKKIKAKIQYGKNTVLKTRRNKKYLSGNAIYPAYISSSAINLPTISSLFERIEEENITISNQLLVMILADAAIQLIFSKENKSGNLQDYLKGNLPRNPYLFLVDDLLVNQKNSEMMIHKYSKLFSFHYTFEENEDILGLLYISLKSMKNRKATGSYYTPNHIVKHLCNKLFSMNTVDHKTILDPCCGTGNFILQLPNDISYKQVYGSDIDEISVKIARINYALKYNISNQDILITHIMKKDYLFDIGHEKFDYIIGNPPWGYVYSEKEKQYLRKKYKSISTFNIESYDLFVEKALSNLQKNGVLSFVLPEAFLQIKAHLSIREILLQNSSIQYLAFLGNAFQQVQCPSIILQTIFTGNPFQIKGMIVNDGEKEFIIQKTRDIHPEQLSFTMTDEEYDIIQKLNQLPNKVTLYENAIFALGIVTGNNQKYLTTKKGQNYEMVLRGADLYKYKIKSSNHYLIFEPSSFQQVAKEEYYRAKEKLLYRFVCNQLVFAYDDKQTLSLNSANILIPQIKGLSTKYIMAILNSRVAGFYFKKQFSSVKVLRSHIEQIPIPFLSKKEQEKIISFVDMILTIDDKKEILTLYNELDQIIAHAYHLNKQEYQLIQSALEKENLFLF